MLPLILLTALVAEKPIATIKLESPVSSNKLVKGVLTVTFPDGQHGYQNPPADEYENPVRLSVLGKAFRLVKADYPKGAEYQVAGAEKPTRIYEGTIQIPFTLSKQAALPKGTSSLSFQLDYQLCTARSCYPPATMVVKAPLKGAVKS